MAQGASPDIVQRLSSRDPGVRTKACAEVLFGSQLGLQLGHLVEPLIHMLDDEEPDVRYVAAVCLGAIGDGRAVLPLIDRLGDQGGCGGGSARPLCCIWGAREDRGQPRHRTDRGMLFTRERPEGQACYPCRTGEAAAEVQGQVIPSQQPRGRSGSVRV